MNTKLLVVAAALTALVSIPARASAQSITGLWDATVVVSNGAVQVPFRMELSGSGPSVKGSFFNGDDRVTSSTGSFENGSLVLVFEEYETKLEATLKDGVLEGQYDRGTAGPAYPFTAKRFTPSPLDRADVPPIAGVWNVQVKSSKGENAWQLVVRQSGAEVSAVIVRVDGDTGTLTGTYGGGKFVLSHFSGARPLRVELTPQADGTLSVVQNNNTTAWMAMRAEIARARGLPEPSDPSRFTTLIDPTEPLRFSFPDLTGRVVSSTDERFKGKVVILNILGSWCPNCHDEVPFLVDLYRKHRDRGLEIIGLSFEEAAQLKNPTRLRAFIKRYGVDYPVLLPGEPKELAAKLPQAVNLNSFPTSFFIGRDGRVRSVHAGFAGKATGEIYERGIAEVTAFVERLLAEKPATTASR